MTIQQFEQAIKDFGIEEACLYFGYKKGDWFIGEMKKKLMSEPAPELEQNPVQPKESNVDLSKYADWLQIWTDGACSENGKPDAIGGFGAVLVFNGREKPIWGYKDAATNQQMELLAVIKAFENTKNHDFPTVIFSDSNYLVKCFNEKWFENWQENEWKTADGNPVMNQDLWRKLIEIHYDYVINEVKLEFVYVTAHAVLKYNEQADQLAKKGIALGKRQKGIR